MLNVVLYWLKVFLVPAPIIASKEHRSKDLQNNRRTLIDYSDKCKGVHFHTVLKYKFVFFVF